MSDAWAKVPAGARQYIYETLEQTAVSFLGTHTFNELAAEIGRIAEESVELTSAGDGMIGASLDLALQHSMVQGRKLVEARRRASVELVIAESIRVAIRTLIASEGSDG